MLDTTPQLAATCLYGIDPDNLTIAPPTTDTTSALPTPAPVGTPLQTESTTYDAMEHLHPANAYEQQHHILPCLGSPQPVRQAHLLEQRLPDSVVVMGTRSASDEGHAPEEVRDLHCHRNEKRTNLACMIRLGMAQQSVTLQLENWGLSAFLPEYGQHQQKSIEEQFYQRPVVMLSGAGWQAAVHCKAGHA